MDESEIKELLNFIATSNDSAKESLEQQGWSVKEYIGKDENFDISPFQDLILGSSSVITIGYFGGMITFHAFESDGEKIKDYFDVDDDFESLDPSEQSIDASLPAILTALGITVSTKVGDTGGQEYAFTEDELIVASRLGIGGGKPFRMPKPLNWTIAFPIKREIIDNLKAQM